LVLSGGGARAAYQVGVLQGIAEILREASFPSQHWPFALLSGASAGALNATYLASRAQDGLAAIDDLARFWAQLHSPQVYRLHAPRWARWSLLLAGWVLARQARQHRALLDNTPLADTLHRHIALTRIDEAMAAGTLQALTISASSYSSGHHWTFCQTADPKRAPPESQGPRRSSVQPITIEHLLASAAIPFLFRAVPLWVRQHREYFGDGSIRQTAPLSPALHLGAQRILAIGVGQPVGEDLQDHADEPLAGTIAAHTLAGVMSDQLLTDVARAQRMNQAIAELPGPVQGAIPFRHVPILAIYPSASLDDLALAHVQALPPATRATLLGLNALEGVQRHSPQGGAALASYLLFEPSFTQALLALGRRDALAQQAAIRHFFHMEVR
jgi:NTE family protein